MGEFDWGNAAGNLLSQWGGAAIAQKYQPATAAPQPVVYVEGTPAKSSPFEGVDKKWLLIGGGVAALVAVVFLLKR